MSEHSTPTPDELPAWATSTFEVGLDDALVGPTTFGLVEAGHPSTRDRLWALIATETPLDDVLDELGSGGLKSLPSFGLVQQEDGGVRIVVRGDARVTVRHRDGSIEVIDAHGVRTWAEAVSTSVERVDLAIGDDAPDTVDDSSRYFVLAGVVAASTVGRGFVDSDTLADRARVGWSPGVALPAAPRALADLSVPVPPSREIPEPTEPELPEPPEPPKPEPREPDPPQPELPDPRPDVPEPEFPEPPPDLPEPEVPEPPKPHFPQPSAIPMAFDIESARGGPVPATPGFISSVPVARTDDRSAEPGERADADPGERADAGEPAEAGEPDGDADDLTISREELLRRRGGTSEPGLHQVRAVLCVNGHPNAPHAAVCRQCGGAVELSEVVVIDRPILGTLEFSNGQSVPVDRALLIGRNPKVGQAHAGELPRIVRFDDVGAGLSRTHAQVVVEGWSMMIEDLGSRNGTEVTLPGQPARRLHPGEPVAIEIGTVVELDIDLTFTLVAP